MKRRRFLSTLTLTTAGVSGCLDGRLSELAGEGTAPADEALGGTATDQRDDETAAGVSSNGSGQPAPLKGEYGTPADICEQEIIEEFGIRAIVEPAFGDDWTGVDIPDQYLGRDGGLADHESVVGLVDGDRARAYPVSVLWWHEIVNDTFGEPVIVTFCSLCRSGMVASRRVRGEPTTFGVSGQLWIPPELQTRAAEGDERVIAVEEYDASADLLVRNQSNLVMYDEATRSFWSQLLAGAICGPMTGTRLEFVPFTVATWGEWREGHPGTEVLLPPPHSSTM